MPKERGDRREGEWAKTGFGREPDCVPGCSEIAGTHLSKVRCYFNLIFTAACARLTAERLTGLMHRGNLLRARKTSHVTLPFFFPPSKRFCFVSHPPIFFVPATSKEKSKDAITTTQREKQPWLKAPRTVIHLRRQIHSSGFILMQTGASVPVSAKKIMEFLDIWETCFLSLNCGDLVECKGKVEIRCNSHYTQP